MSIQRYFAAAEVRPTTGIAARVADVALVFGVIAIVALMILPLPALIIDFLVGINITFGVLLLLTTLYIRGPLEFSAFPSILLISTLFRLALSISTTRMILVEGHAGHIIQTFGKMVAGGNLVVGLVVFLIITIVQFIVIAKGAERVAEVAARFSLDSMPGKQLSIDSDLRAGLIDKDDARRRRRLLEQESKLHGSLDGAMKFVKGDAIASIVIVIVNLIGGLAIGVMQQGLDVGQAIEKYSILSIGEGLVAQIPALLGAMAAGLIVTRSSDDERESNLGETIQRQLSANPRVLIFVGVIAFLMALVPGFPSLVFVALGIGAIAAGASSHHRLKPYVERFTAPLRATLRRGEDEVAPVALLAAADAPKPVVPLLLELHGRKLSAEQAHDLAAMFTAMLEALQYRAGIPLPRLALHLDPEAEEERWRLLAFEVAIGQGDARDDADMLVDAVREALRRHLAMFVGVQEATMLLNQIGADYPEVVKEAVRAVPAARIAEILRRLIEEEVPLRNMRDVLEAIAEAGGQEREAARIADLTRISLKRYLLAAHAGEEGLKALVVTAELEELIRGKTRILDGVERLALEPEIARSLVDAIGTAAADTGATVLVTAFDTRRALRKLIEAELFDMPVLSYNELSPLVRLDMRGQIGLPPQALEEKAPQAIAAE